MSSGRIRLFDITLDESGRVILSDDVLAEVEAHFDATSAGGLNGSCPDTSNGNCFNSYCSGSRNQTECTNQTTCDGAHNHRLCYDYPI